MTNEKLSLMDGRSAKSNEVGYRSIHKQIEEK